jgi:hypothetical protein
LNSQHISTLADYQSLLQNVGNLQERREYFFNHNLLNSPTGDHETSRNHSEIIDKFIGFNIAEIENNLFLQARAKTPQGNLQTWGASIHKGNQTWVGLWHQTLQTPYSELKEICDLLNPTTGSLLLDLGAGYGRLGIVLHALYPGSKFKGYEYVAERVEEGAKILNDLKCTHAELIQVDLTLEDFSLPEADFYFIYDYGTIKHIRQTLKQIELMAGRKKFKVIARGKGVISIIENEHPWLSKVFPVLRQENFNIYSMSGT